MTYYIVKIAVTAALVVAISELAKRSPLWAALLASLPLISLLSLIWLYTETRDIERIVAFSWGVFWLVLPSLVLFVTLPVLLRQGLAFVWALPAAVVLMLAAYAGMREVLVRIGIQA